MNPSFTKILNIYIPYYPFGAVSQNYLRWCLLGCSPHFIPSKTHLATLTLCIFLVNSYGGQWSDLSRLPSFAWTSWGIGALVPAAAGTLVPIRLLGECRWELSWFSDILYGLRPWVLFGGGGAGYLLPLPAERYWGRGAEICWGTSTNTPNHCGQWPPPQN